jgi:hypothetical protein
MSDKEKARRNLAELLNFVENAPANEEIISMDCNDHCEQLACLAEQVASGADLNIILPELTEHMKYWGDCREEFIALVNVLKAEISDELPNFEE